MGVRIEKRKKERAEQIRIRMEREKEERAQKEQEEENKLREAEEAKKRAIQNMSQTGNLRQQNRRGGGRQTEKEKKKKALADRRKPLNIDHLTPDKLREKAGEMMKWFAQLEEESYDFKVRLERQKYDINLARQRIQEYNQKLGKGGKSNGPRRPVVGVSVGNRAGAFK